MISGKRSSEDMMMESPEKKPSLFSSFQPTQPQQQPALFSGFGASQDNNNPQTNGLFGSVSQPQQPQNNLFAQNQSSQSVFGTIGQNSKNEALPNVFGGQTQPKEQTPTPPQSFGSSFGQQQEAPKTPFGQLPSSQTSQAPSFNMFGHTATQAQQPTPMFATSAPSQPSSPFKFGGAASTTSTSINPFAGLQDPASSTGGMFGQQTETSTAMPAESQAPTSQPSTGLFGQPSASTSTSSVFGKTPSPTKETSRFAFGSVSQPGPSSAPTDEAAQAAKNPFASLVSSAPMNTSTEPAVASGPVFSFGAPPAPSVGPLGTSSATPVATSTSGLFGIPTTSQPGTSNIFNTGDSAKSFEHSNSTAAATSTPKSPEKNGAEPSPTKPIFSFGSTQPTSSGGFFTPSKPTQTEKPPATEPVKSSLFGGNATPLFQKAPAQVPEPATEKPKKALFGRPLDGSSALSQPSALEPATKALDFNATTPGEQADPTEPSATPSIFAASPAVKPAAQEIPLNAPPSQPTGNPPKRAVYTKSPARIPNYLNGEGYKEYDANYRLRALNREFQRRIALLNSSRQDFENLVRHYVSARASIGADIGLYQRNMAGTKRKNDTIDEEELEVPQQYKKAKGDAGQSIDGPASTTSSSLFSAPAQQSNQRTMLGTSKSANEKDSSASSPSKATSMLNNMIPKSPGKAPSDKSTSSNQPTSVFASVPIPENSFLRGVVNSIEESGPQSQQPSASTTPKKSPPKPPPAAPSVFKGNAFAAFGQAAATDEKKRKAAKLDDFDSDEDSQAEGQKQLEEEDRAKRARYDAIPKTGFTPMFGARPGAPKSSPSKAKRTSPFERDSDEDDVEAEADDEETAEERDADFVPGEEETSESDEGDTEDGGEEEELAEDEAEDAEDEGNDTDDIDHQAEIDANPNTGKSLFDRVEPNPEKKTEPKVNGENVESKGFGSNFNFNSGNEIGSGFTAKNSSFKPRILGADAVKSTPEAPTFSPITPATTSPYKPSIFSFQPTPPTTTPTPALGSSVLAGGSTSAGFAKFEGMFGSRPSTPNPPETEKETAASLPGPVNHTWTVGSPIRFGTTSAPNINVTEASPEKDKDGDKTPKPNFSGLFGTPASGSAPKSADASLGFSFGSKPAPGFLSATKSLVPESGLSSGLSSRGTSPGLTDNESVATNDTDSEVPTDPQASYGDSRAGEEHEDCLFEAKSKALRFITKDGAVGSFKGKEDTWQTVGAGVIRLLKNKDTNKARIVFRAEPGGNIIVNSNILPKMVYRNMDQGKSSGAVTGGLWNERDSRLERWVFKLKTGLMAEELAAMMMEYQPQGD